MNLDIGSTIGDYQVIGILGAGGMGKVYKVRNVISDRVEAMKVLLPDLANAPDLADRFLREIKVQASLEHPNIAGLHTAVRFENQLLMLMEFVDGVTLDQRLKDGPLPAPLAVNYIMQVLSALDYAHAHGVVHRDIKPANMMLTGGGMVKLMDFGIAKAASDQKLTMTGTTMGSLYYMSPEQIEGAASLDGRSDLYSVGVSLYELVTGKHPFDGDSQFSIMSAHLKQTPVPPIDLDPRLPRALNDMILMSVSRDPNQRFQGAAAFRNALSGIAGNVATPVAAPVARVAPPVAALASVAQKDTVGATTSRGKRGLWIAIGALATAALLIGMIQFGPLRRSKAAAPAATTQIAPVAPAPEPAAPVSPPAAAEVPASSVTAPPEKQASAPAAQTAKPVRSSQPVRQTQTAAPQQQQAQPEMPPPQPATQQAPLPPPRPVNPGPSREEIQAAREQYTLLNARAMGIRTSLQTLQQSQAASGMNLRGDMQQASSLMNSYMEGADSAINGGDMASAKSSMEKAERQIEKLEKFLNR
jgi:serine/threonine-protein kinase